jgi:hypothetical protein
MLLISTCRSCKAARRRDGTRSSRTPRDVRDQLLQLAHGPLVDLEHAVVRDTVDGRLEAVEVAQQVAQRVADLAVGVLRAADQLIVAAHVLW